ncbi:MAG: ATP-binding cassette domain-containing protein [Candidatus Hodarchaeota archaeon]
MKILIEGANENNLQNINVEFEDGLTVVTGISGSGKSSLVFSTLYHEARRRFSEIFTRGSKPRLAPAHVHRISGLGPTIAIEQNILNRNPLSTLATASGLHPFFRIFYINYGKYHCPECESDIIYYSEDEIIDLISQYSRSGSISLYASLVKGVPGSHRTLLQSLAEEFGREVLLVDRRWYQSNELDPQEPHDIEIKIATINKSLSSNRIRKLVQKIKALGANAINIRFGTQGQNLLTLPLINICPMCNRWIRKVKSTIFNISCPFCKSNGCNHCQETGLHPEALTITWKGLNFPNLLNLSIAEADTLFKELELPSSAERLIFEIKRRLNALMTVGLGYITLNRSSPTLSRGESQRVRLAVALVSRLEDMVHVLDEPTIGLSIVDVTKLLPAFQQLKGPVIFVEHDRIAAASADRAVDLGPGAGINGGNLVYSGTLPSLWKTEGYTGRFFSLHDRVTIPKLRSLPTQFLEIIEANQHNLQEINIRLPIGRLTVITGPSGSGKSTFLENVLYKSLKCDKPIGCKQIKGIKLKPILVDQSPIGKNPRSNPGTYTNLAGVIRDIFAKSTKLSSSHFSFNREEGWCKNCKGMGAIEVKMRFLPSTWICCDLCEGKRFSREVLSSTVKFKDKSLSIADFYEFSVDEAYEWFVKNTKVALTSKERTTAKRILKALQDVGLGYLPLGQPSPTLSGGEAQRVKLAKYLGKKSLKEQLILLDEPSTGLHPYDVSCLLSVLDQLVRTGATVIVVEHNSDFIRAADWIVDLGPGAGPEGGRLIYSGAFQGLLKIKESLTTQGLQYEESIYPKSKETRPERKISTIQVNNASANNLKNITVEFPKGAVTAVTGVSGSGKSSLITDVLKAEAERRYLETLSLYERQSVREGPEAPVESVSGLGVTISVDPHRIGRWYNYRSTVGLITEISHHLTILLSNFGDYLCSDCSISCQRQQQEWVCPRCNKSYPIPEPKYLSPTHYVSACNKCQGVGTLQIPKPEKLIIHPEKPLCKGAMYSPGFFPKGYLCKRYNGGYYVVQALANRFHFNPMSTPWNEMSFEAQRAFLFGTEKPLEVEFESRSRKIGNYTRTIDFRGFYGWIGDWDVGGTYSISEKCPECNGTKFKPEYLKVTLGTYNIFELNEMPFESLLKTLQNLSIPDIHTHVAKYSLETILHRLNFLNQVGLGYINASRIVMTLSAGEAQRIRLAGLLGSNLTSLTVLLDEPTRGLHPNEIDGLLNALNNLSEDNTVIVVEHDLQVIKAADHIIDMGPGPGEFGGTIVAQGTVKDISNSNTLTGMWLQGKRRFSRPKKYASYRKPQGWLKLYGASQNNLKGDPMEIPLGTLVGVCGVSGSGKSTLLIDTLGRILAPRKHTTSVAYEPIEPGKFDSIEGAPSRTVIIDQSKQEVTSPFTYLNLRKPLISLYAGSEDAKAAELDEKELFQQCSACKGRGRIRMDMGFLPDVFTRCDTCQGTGLTAEAWMIRLNGLTLPELYNLTLDQIYDLFKSDERISRPLKAVKDVGLGYLVLRQPRIHLSGGECQRLKIAKELYQKRSRSEKSTLYILDEPTVGQHLQDVSRLLKILHHLVDEGHTVVVIEHHPHVLAASDWIIEIGPVGGPKGGYIVASGTPMEIAQGDTPTAQYLRAVLEGQL